MLDSIVHLVICCLSAAATKGRSTSLYPVSGRDVLWLHQGRELQVRLQLAVEWTFDTAITPACSKVPVRRIMYRLSLAVSVCAEYWCILLVVLWQVAVLLVALAWLVALASCGGA